MAAPTSLRCLRHTPSACASGTRIPVGTPLPVVNKVLPAFLEILRQLTPVQVRILDWLYGHEHESALGFPTCPDMDIHVGISAWRFTRTSVDRWETHSTLEIPCLKPRLRHSSTHVRSTPC